MDKKRIFIDGVESVSLTEGVIRMEIFNIPPRTDLPNAGKHEVTGELIMTPQGFVRAFSAMENLVNQLEKAGVIKRNSKAGNGGAAKQEDASPNFN